MAVIDPLRNKLRRELRQRRRAVSPFHKQLAAKRVVQLFIRSGWLRRGQRIAVYLAIAEELDLQPLIRTAWRRGCKLFVPHIINSKRREMMFYPFHVDSQFITHQWGIKQLARRPQPVVTRALDVVLIPTVGYDDKGHRLGMGGGFYDRHFASLRRIQSHRPALIGVAYACQRVSEIGAQAHDIQLDAILTEHSLKWF